MMSEVSKAPTNLELAVVLGFNWGRMGDVSRDGFGEVAAEEGAERIGVVDARLSDDCDVVGVCGELVVPALSSLCTAACLWAIGLTSLAGCSEDSITTTSTLRTSRPAVPSVDARQAIVSRRRRGA